MKNHCAAITLSVFLGCMSLPAVAQQPTPKPQDQIPAEQQNPEDGLMQPRDMTEHGAMMYGGRMGREGMMAHVRRIHQGWMGHHHARMNPVLMRTIFALMDSDGDGTVSLQEWQAAQEKVFRAMDPDKDGTITFEEMMNFFRGRARAPASPGR